MFLRSFSSYYHFLNFSCAYYSRTFTGTCYVFNMLNIGTCYIFNNRNKCSNSCTFFFQNDVKKPRNTKHLHTVLLQEGGSTITKTVQLTLKQSAGTNARIATRLETTSSHLPTPPGSPVVKVSVSLLLCFPVNQLPHTVLFFFSILSVFGEEDFVNPQRYFHNFICRCRSSSKFFNSSKVMMPWSCFTRISKRKKIVKKREKYFKRKAPH